MRCSTSMVSCAPTHASTGGALSANSAFTLCALLYFLNHFLRAAWMIHTVSCPAMRSRTPRHGRMLYAPCQMQPARGGVIWWQVWQPAAVAKPWHVHEPDLCCAVYLRGGLLASAPSCADEDSFQLPTFNLGLNGWIVNNVPANAPHQRTSPGVTAIANGIMGFSRTGDRACYKLQVRCTLCCHRMRPSTHTCMWNPLE
jgi:hypothetical protein